MAFFGTCLRFLHLLLICSVYEPRKLWVSTIFFSCHMFVYFYYMDSCDFLALLCQKGEKHCINIALGRSSALHTYIHIQLYLMMMMMIWIETSLSVQKLLGFLRKVSTLKTLQMHSNGNSNLASSKPKRERLLEIGGTTWRSVKKFCVFTCLTLWVTFVLIVASQSLSFHVYIMHHRVEVIRLFLKLETSSVHKSLYFNRLQGWS